MPRDSLSSLIAFATFFANSPASPVGFRPTEQGYRVARWPSLGFVCLNTH